jgi:regulator of nonsense transcripts 1
MPPQIGDFISRHVYEGELQSHLGHVIPSTATTCRFIDVNGLEKRREKGTSLFVSVALGLGKRPQPRLDAFLQNPEEVEAVVLLARHLQDQNVSYRIITPYDAQRNEIKRALQRKDLNWQDKCFNVDSFQGLFSIPTRNAPDSLATDARN